MLDLAQRMFRGWRAGQVYGGVVSFSFVRGLVLGPQKRIRIAKELAQELVSLRNWDLYVVN